MIHIIMELSKLSRGFSGHSEKYNSPEGSMEQKLSIYDLSRYLSDRKWRSVLYSTTEQEWYDEFGSVPEQELVFSSVTCCINPNIVMLSGSGGRMYITGLQYALIEDTVALPLVSVTLVGRDFYRPKKEVCYSLSLFPETEESCS